MRAHSIITLILLLLASVHASAAYLTTTQLFQYLEEDMRGGEEYGHGFASGYAIGLADAVDGTIVCIPKGTSVKQVKLVLFNFLKAHPERWASAAEISVVKALQDAWPCKQQ
jgi:hypothetical protein